MTRIHQLIPALAAVTCLGMGSAAMAQDCTPNHEFDTVNAGKLTVALTNTPPYSLEKDGDIAGIDSDLVKHFASENCLDIDYKVYTYPGAITAVSSRRADIALGGFYRTAARAKVVALSAPVYLDQLSVTTTEGYSTVEALEGKKVGTVEGYLWVQDLETLYGDNVSTYPNSLNLAQDLHAGRIEAALDGFGASVVQNGDKDEYTIKVLEETPEINATLDPSQTAFLLDKTNEAFIEAMNTSLEQYREAGIIDEALSAYKVDPSASQVGEYRVIE